MSSFYKTAPAGSRTYEVSGTALAPEQSFDTSPMEPSRTHVRPSRRQPYKGYHYFLLVFLFLYCSRIPEMVPFFRFGILMQPILLIGLFMTKRFRLLARIPAGRYLIAFGIWMGVCVPFSTWRGGSVTVFLQTAQAILLVAFMLAFIQTVSDCLRAMFTVGLAMGTAAALSLVGGGGADSRLGLGQTMLGDSNTLCLYALLGLPLLYVTFTLSTGFKKYLSLALLIPILVAAARTASRAGLFILVAGLLLFFLHATVKQKVVIFWCVIALLLATLLLPQRVRQRFTTYFEESDPKAEPSEAVQSAEARRYLLIRSLKMTAENPIFGVGPGSFMTAEAEMATREGVKPSWHVSHNSYTEVSSETGIPGVLLYLAVFGSSYWGLVRLRKRGSNFRIRRMALFTQIALTMVMVGAFFLSIAYGGVLFPILGLSIALPLAAQREVLTTKAVL